MPKHGMCSACGETVWLTDNGACVRGHGPECISGAVETAPQGGPAPLPVPPPGPVDGGKKSRTLIIAAVVAVVLLVCCLVGGILVAIAIPVFNAASTTARESMCFSQQRVIDGAIEQWLAADEDHRRDDLTDYDAVVDAIVPEYIPLEQVCPDGGTYEYDATTSTISCTVHGEYF